MSPNQNRASPLPNPFLACKKHRFNFSLSQIVIIMRHAHQPGVPGIPVVPGFPGIPGDPVGPMGPSLPSRLSRPLQKKIIAYKI